MKIIVDIKPHEDGVRCGECEHYYSEDFRHSGGGFYDGCNLFGIYGIDGQRFHACLAAERKLKALVEAGAHMRRTLTTEYDSERDACEEWDAALADMEGEG